MSSRFVKSGLSQIVSHGCGYDPRGSSEVFWAAAAHDRPVRPEQDAERLVFGPARPGRACRIRRCADPCTLRGGGVPARRIRFRPHSIVSHVTAFCVARPAARISARGLPIHRDITALVGPGCEECHAAVTVSVHVSGVSCQCASPHGRRAAGRARPRVTLSGSRAVSTPPYGRVGKLIAARSSWCLVLRLLRRAPGANAP